MDGIDKGMRLTNYLIDSFIIIVISIVPALLFNDYLRETEVVLSTMFLYYFVLESSTGQTLGKMVTKTKVVNRDGSKPKVWRIFMRSFLRLIPIDNFSYLFGTAIGFHDSLSLTKLKKEN